jgi:hypothetical protein
MRNLLASLLVLLAACGPNEPRRLLVGHGDTLVLNYETEIEIPVNGIDWRGRLIPVRDARFERVGQGPIEVSERGRVTCTEHADLRVRAVRRELSTEFLLRCRPVHRAYIAGGPFHFVIGDTSRFLLSDDPQKVDIAAYDRNFVPVGLIAPTLTAAKPNVVRFEGMTIRPVAVGGTVIGARVGYRDGGAGVHVYERVRDLDGLRDDQRFAAVPLEFGEGEMRKWTLGAGSYMFTMIPYADSLTGLRLRIENANCMKEYLSPRRHSCFTPGPMSVIVWHPGKNVAAGLLKGELLVRRIDPPRRSQPASIGTNSK